jgi:ADP-heptose:LPS heptosyltransferase
MKEPFLSAVIITYNESHNIERCLRSLIGVADEIIVVDSGSTDDTKAKCQAMGATVYEHKFEGHIQQKNWAASQATGTWLLSLDADESLSEELSASLMKWKGSLPEHLGYRVNRLTSYCGHWVRHGGWYPDQKTRLWRRGDAEWMGENPHDRLELSSSGSTGHLPGDLLHHSYHSVEDHIQQIEYFSDIAAAHYAGPFWATAVWLLPLKMAFQWTKNALIRGGWRDGWAGWTIAKYSAIATAKKYQKARRFQRSVRLLQTAGKSRIEKVLVCRTDAIGDVVLSLPIVSWMKETQPNLEVDFLARSYAAPVVEAAIDVDQVLIWTEREAIDFSKYDAAIVAFPDVQVVKSLREQGVPIVVGTGRRWPFRRWLTHTNNTSRKDSGLHEAWHGLELAKSLHPSPGWNIPGLKLPNMSGGMQALGRLEPGSWSALSQGVVNAENWILSGEKHAIVHPGSAGSANNWSVRQYQELIQHLADRGYRVLITGTSAEAEQLGFDQIDFPESVVNTMGKLDLSQLLALIGVSNVLVASSTGPLHMAAAANVACVGLYGPEAPAWPERWHPLGPRAQWITSDKVDSRKLDSKGGALAIDVGLVLKAIERAQKVAD